MTVDGDSDDADGAAQCITVQHSARVGNGVVCLLVLRRSPHALQAMRRKSLDNIAAGRLVPHGKVDHVEAKQPYPQPLFDDLVLADNVRARSSLIPSLGGGRQVTTTGKCSSRPVPSPSPRLTVVCRCVWELLLRPHHFGG